jgi:hypothetical protein
MISVLPVYGGRVTGAGSCLSWAVLSRDDPNGTIAPAAFDPIERRIVDYIAAGNGCSTAEIAHTRIP